MLDTKATRRPFDVSKIEEELEMPVNPRLPLLETREHTHGKYQDVAIISQSLKSFMRASGGWANLTDIERESMDMIAVKFARTLAGRSMSKQHWEDVEGYARLVVEQCV